MNRSTQSDPHLLIALVGMLLLVLTLPQVIASPFCDFSDIREACQVETPSYTSNCTNYTIIDSYGSIFSAGNLTLSAMDIYYFNLTTIGTGSYIIRLCDGTTREAKMAAPVTYIAQPAKELIYTGIDVGTPGGIAALFFVLALWITLVIFGIIAKNNGIGWVMTMAGFLGLVFGIILGLMFSVVIGGIVALISLALIFIGFL